MKQKADYLASSIRKTFTGEGFSCPSCGHSTSTVVMRKYLVTALRRCNGCMLLFRTPTTTVIENKRFYQEEYTQGFTTDCPTDKILSKYVANGFLDSGKDYSAYIEIVRAAGGETGHRLFDFGCSWGYGSWQFAHAGFEVEAFEISVPRARFAREKLGVMVHSALSEVLGDFDVFFSSHVLEHVPSVEEAINFGWGILRPGGLFVAFTPNGSLDFRQKAGDEWNKLWGLVHPNFLDETYYEKRFLGKDFLVLSAPYSIQKVKAWKNSPHASASLHPLDGNELLVLVKK